MRHLTKLLLPALLIPLLASVSCQKYDRLGKENGFGVDTSSYEARWILPLGNLNLPLESVLPTGEEIKGFEIGDDGRIWVITKRSDADHISTGIHQNIKEGNPFYPLNHGRKVPIEARDAKVNSLLSGTNYVIYGLSLIVWNEGTAPENITLFGQPFSIPSGDSCSFTADKPMEKNKKEFIQLFPNADKKTVEYTASCDSIVVTIPNTGSDAAEFGLSEYPLPFLTDTDPEKAKNYSYQLVCELKDAPAANTVYIAQSLKIGDKFYKSTAQERQDLYFEGGPSHFPKYLVKGETVVTDDIIDFIPGGPVDKTPIDSFPVVNATHRLTMRYETQGMPKVQQTYLNEKPGAYYLTKVPKVNVYSRTGIDPRDITSPTFEAFFGLAKEKDIEISKLVDIPKFQEEFNDTAVVADIYVAFLNECAASAYVSLELLNKGKERIQDFEIKAADPDKYGGEDGPLEAREYPTDPKDPSKKRTLYKIAPKNKIVVVKCPVPYKAYRSLYQDTTFIRVWRKFDIDEIANTGKTASGRFKVQVALELRATGNMIKSAVNQFGF